MPTAPTTHQDKIAWLRLLRCPTIGPMAFRRLIKKYGSAGEALEALPQRLKNKNITIPSVADIEQEWQGLEKIGGKFIWLNDDNYPPLLAQTEDAPPVLSLLGHEHLLKRDCFAIVGTREASIAGEKLAKRFAEVLSQKSYVLVSGMAKGIDTQVHVGSLEAGTVAVLAGGVDNIYPRENEKLYHSIKEVGVIISESPLGSPPLAKNFPKRNRIISGISFGLLVIEAALRSGTLITANYALEQGRELFAVPGSPLDQRMRGCNQLIRNGAHITESPDDILPVLEASSLRKGGMAEQDISPAEPTKILQEEFTEDQMDLAKRTLRKNLSTAPTNLDDVLANWQMERGLFYQALLEIELAGEVEHIQGNNYALSVTLEKNGAIRNLF